MRRLQAGHRGRPGKVSRTFEAMAVESPIFGCLAERLARGRRKIALRKFSADRSRPLPSRKAAGLSQQATLLLPRPQKLQQEKPHHMSQR
jgi:hypothetical protein